MLNEKRSKKKSKQKVIFEVKYEANMTQCLLIYDSSMHSGEKKNERVSWWTLTQFFVLMLF